MCRLSIVYCCRLRVKLWTSTSRAGSLWALAAAPRLSTPSSASVSSWKRRSCQTSSVSPRLSRPNRCLIAQHKLTLTSLDESPVIDVTIDGADEVDLQLNCIKGGGGCQLQEKVVAFAAKKFVIVADYRKESKKLGEHWTQGVPVEVVPMAYVPLMRYLEEKFGGKPVLRMGKCKAGPVVTDNGNFVLDVNFGEIDDPKTLCDSLKLVPGVVEVGLFCSMAEKAFFGQTNGSVTTRVAPKSAQ
uniref:ribose-5-phosphate isomerase n=1 Tax=Hyaloperonospora arabidopsidis (strain Emoy2) TaxID=559515 RepID=M4BAQ5_HYAAE